MVNIYVLINICYTQEIKVETSSSVIEATQLLLEEADPDEIILITGSLYMVGEARERWFPKENHFLDLPLVQGLTLKS